MQISSLRPPHPQHGDLWLVDLGGPGQPGGPVEHEQVRGVSLDRLERLAGSISPQVHHNVQYVIRRLLVR